MVNLVIGTRLLSVPATLKLLKTESKISNKFFIYYEDQHSEGVYPSWTRFHFENKKFFFQDLVFLLAYVIGNFRNKIIVTIVSIEDREIMRNHQRILLAI